MPFRHRALHGHLGLLLALAATALACATPVTVRRTPASAVHRALTANVLSTGTPSDASTQLLHARDLYDHHRAAPDQVLRLLREAWLEDPEDLQVVFALAELEFLRGERLSRSARARPHFLAAAYYAYHFLSLSRPGERGLDPRYRLAADLYNRGLTAGLATEDGTYVDLGSRSLALPFGTLRLKSDPTELDWGGYRMTHFIPVAELEVRGLRNRYRRRGIGAPLAASLEPAEPDALPPGAGHISRLVRVAATAIVFFDGGRSRAQGDEADGSLHLFTLDDRSAIDLPRGRYPLESEPTAALAFGLAESRPWEFEGRGFLWADFGEEDRGVRMLAPYDRNRIPVVFVHGTASSPWRWAEMINHLQSDPELHARYQFWLFQYNTGVPIAFSAGLLREGLEQLVAELDPEGDDEKLRRMVVVGHSQGGLLAKMCVVDPGDAFWSQMSSAPIDELDLRPETRRLMERSLLIEPLPFVERVIFIATPHRGSFMAERWYARLAARMSSLPGDLVDAVGDLVIVEDDRVLMRGIEDIPSSIDNMTGDHPFLQTLAELPIAPGVEAHSIIAVSHEDPDPALAHDGVVTVKSQRLEGVQSEFIVHSDHSTQRHPITIREVARILRSALGDEAP